MNYFVRIFLIFGIILYVINVCGFSIPCASVIYQSLATQVRKQLHASRKKGEPVQGFNFSTTSMITRYLQV